jgi:drug/metabolite transporter (DMT)-like permease
MNYQTTLLYLTTVAIWGSTWLVITFQLGTVDPIISVIYRMALASVLLFSLCRFLGVTLRATRLDHFFFMIQGVLSFGVNFWLIYMSEMYLTSGIIAVIFSLIVFFNLVNGRIFLNRPIERNTALGGLVGLCGLYLLFSPELSNASSQQNALTGFGLALTAVFSASLGNMAATRSGMLGHSVWRINAWSTLYGASALSIIAVFTGTPFTFDYSAEYTISLIYLSVFGTILAFGAYLKLMVIIGPEKASYGALMIPFVAIGLSTIFEGYQWTIMAACGFLLALVGNYLVMRKPR